ncbi:CDC25-like phosphatase YCH1 [Escovopsis weberi]|uniref:CDC25-like phosphatase YCH1 n=1 Tax=Escovopsis weberi TaxID=150374 RepID=A0A0N0RTQ7_ESCWE|nr:CDC25-like phosphatase YCH1 [Escovopsis weberi]
MTTVAGLKRISAKALSEKILAEKDLPERTFAIVDVRDSDYIGGHIRGAINIPSTSLDAMMPTLIRRVQGARLVVFHCALSQQRGPSAALKYLRQRPAGEGQEVCVLDEGFSGWQREYGGDERLTEGWVKELWENY